MGFTDQRVEPKLALIGNKIFHSIIEMVRIESKEHLKNLEREQRCLYWKATAFVHSLSPERVKIECMQHALRLRPLKDSMNALYL